MNIIRSRRVRAIALVVALVVIAAACEATPGDFTGDQHADQVYFDNGSGSWFTEGTATPLFTGKAGDIPVAGDYNGDLKWEPAVLRGTTWISSALADPIVYDPPGMPAGPAASPVGFNTPPPTLLPVPGHYDDTGKTQPAYYDQVDATWWIMGRSGDTQFGLPPAAGGNNGFDLPAPADYDGDGKTDIAIFRPTDGTLHYLSSKTGQEVVIASPAPASYPAYLPVPGDYDGVGHEQFGVTDLGGENWYVDGHTEPIASFIPQTNSLDEQASLLPAPASYDGNNRDQPADVDVSNGDFWFAGQPQPPTLGTPSEARVPAVYPDAIIINLVRLTIYARCRMNSSGWPAGTC